jgi:hypothetical protein
VSRTDSDSFIEEVSDEVRRERLFTYFRRYGWIALVVVVAIVAGAAWNEWSKARDRAAAEARGSAVLAALDQPDAAARLEALRALELEGGAEAVAGMLTAAAALEAEDREAAAAALAEVEAGAEASRVYRDMAVLKRVILTAENTPPADRIAALEPLTQPGAPFRVLAEEQIALAELEAGDREAAIARLRALAEDTEASAGLRRRASQLIIALGGEAEAA